MATYSSGSSRLVDVVVLLGIGFELLLDCFEVGVLLVANSLLQNQGLVSVDLDLNHGGFCSAGEFDFSPLLRLQNCEMFLLVASLSLSAIHWGSEEKLWSANFSYGELYEKSQSAGSPRSNHSPL